MAVRESACPLDLNDRSRPGAEPGQLSIASADTHDVSTPSEIQSVSRPQPTAATARVRGRQSTAFPAKHDGLSAAAREQQDHGRRAVESARPRQLPLSALWHLGGPGCRLARRSHHSDQQGRHLRPEQPPDPLPGLQPWEEQPIALGLAGTTGRFARSDVTDSYRNFQSGLRPKREAG